MPAPSTVAPAPSTVAPPPSATPAALPLGDPKTTLAADLDGDGTTETVRVEAHGKVITLTVGAQSVSVEPRPESFHLDVLIPLQVVDLDPKNSRRELLVTYRVPLGEHSSSGYFFFAFSPGKLLPLGTIERGDLSFPGNGSVARTLRDTDACEVAREKAGNTRSAGKFAPRLRSTHRLDAHSQLKQVAEWSVGRVNCEELPACPFVYVLEPDGMTLAGEILRDLRGVSAAGLQSLVLSVRGPTVVVRLAEEKPETTVLDEIYLEAEGRRVAPRACATAPELGFCRHDGRAFLLREGASLELAFDVGQSASPVVLWARGYYQPY
jgi:hypothetical protein